MLLGVPVGVEAGSTPLRLLLLLNTIISIYIYIIVGQVIRDSFPFCRNNACCLIFALKRNEKLVPRRTGPLYPTSFAGLCLLAKRYVFHCFGAGLPGKPYISNEF